MSNSSDKVWKSPSLAVPRIVGRSVGYLVAPYRDGMIRKVGTCPKTATRQDVEAAISRNKSGGFVFFGNGRFEYVEKISENA